MNGFLVMLSCNLDDVPLKLVRTLAEAERYAARLITHYEAVPDEHHPDVIRVCDLMGRDATQDCCVRIVTFRSGRPVRDVVVKGADCSY